jgi:hypothetical protein
MRPERARVFVPLDAPVLLFVCPLLHWIVQENLFPSVSLMGMLQVKLNGLLVEPLDGVGDPKTGG